MKVKEIVTRGAGITVAFNDGSVVELLKYDKQSNKLNRAQREALIEYAPNVDQEEIYEILDVNNNLATVATTGDYDDLVNKPNLGTAAFTDISDYVRPNEVNDFTKQQAFTMTTLQDAANIEWDLNNNAVTQVTLTDDRTLQNPTNQKAGGTYVIIIRQDATGNHTLNFGDVYKWSGNTPPVITPTASAVSILTFISDGTNMYGVPSLDFS